MFTVHPDCGEFCSRTYVDQSSGLFFFLMNLVVFLFFEMGFWRRAEEGGRCKMKMEMEEEEEAVRRRKGGRRERKGERERRGERSMTVFVRVTLERQAWLCVVAFLPSVIFTVV